MFSSKVLSDALNDWNHRNDLLDHLYLMKDDKTKFYEKVLGFWLGSNILLDSIQEDKYFIQLDEHQIGIYSYVYIGYYIVLILDKAISSLHPTSAEAKALKTSLENIIVEYNKSNYLLTSNPRSLFLMFQSIIEKIDDNLEKKSAQYHLVSDAKQYCFNEIKRMYEYAHPYTMYTPLPTTLQRSNAVTLRSVIFSKGLRTGANLLVTDANRLHAFYVSPRITSSDYTEKKIYVPAADGVILDGLIVKKRQNKSRTVVLSLIGHFQSEDIYFNQSIEKIAKLFDTDFVFINHRNYSTRSNRLASSINEIALDVVQFAKYFKQQNKDILLYGMCGGAAHMILASHELQKQHIPFKIILDRSFGRYSDVVDLKAMLRMKLLVPSAVSSPYLPKVVVFLIILLIVIFSSVVLSIAGLNTNFAQFLRMLPENDLLVLQAKSKKIRKGVEPEYTDFFVHPKNDLRHVIKDKRSKNKMLLKKLIMDCRQLAKFTLFNHEIIFVKLMTAFGEYLNLIDNEKLTLPESRGGSEPHDIHGEPLDRVTTRNKMPLPVFLQGFFSSPAQTCDAVVKSVPVYDSKELLEVFVKLNVSLSDDVQLFSQVLSSFLRDIKNNESFICHIGNRLSATGLPTILKPLESLLKSKLFLMASAFKNKSIINEASYSDLDEKLFDVYDSKKESTKSFFI